MVGLAVLVLQVVPADTFAQAAETIDPIRIEQVGGLPWWVEGLAFVAALVSSAAAAYAARASWQSVKVARETNEAQATSRAADRAEQKALRDADRVEQEELREAEREERQEWRAVERRYVYYNAIVARPSLEAIQEYGQRIRSVLLDGAATIGDMHAADDGTVTVKGEVTRLMSETFAAEHNAMTQVLTEAAEAWPDDELREAIREAAEGAAALVAEEGTKLLDPDGRPNFDAALNDGLGAARRVIMDHDPALKAAVSAG